MPKKGTQKLRENKVLRKRNQARGGPTTSDCDFAATEIRGSREKKMLKSVNGKWWLTRKYFKARFT